MSYITRKTIIMSIMILEKKADDDIVTHPTNTK